MLGGRFGGRRLRLIGGGGHASVVAESAWAGAWVVKGFYDDDASASLAGGTARLGPISSVDAGLDGAAVIVAIGDLAVRRGLIDRLAGLRAEDLAVVVDPSASVSVSAGLGGGVFVGPQAVVNARASIGPHAIVNSAAVVEHDCVLGENVHVAPRAALGGRTLVGPNTLIGIGAVVKPGVVIGAGCVVGAGAAVVSDVADGATVRGTPAR